MAVIARRLAGVLALLLAALCGAYALAFTPVRGEVPALAPLWQHADQVHAEGVALYHQGWVWAAWPTSKLLDSLQGTSRPNAPRAATPDWTAWNAVPAQTRWRALHGRDTHSRQVQALLRIEVMATVALVVVLLAIIGFGGRLGRVKPGISHGSARWASRRDLRRLMPRARDRAFVLGYSPKGTLLAMSKHDVDRHVIIVGPPGSGKSAGLIAPNILRHTGGESLVIVDPKSELVRLTYAHLSRYYDIRIVNFTNPAVSSGYNPLAFCTDPLSATSFADSWVGNTGKSANEPFWENAVRTLLVAAILHLNEELRAAGGATLAHLDHFLNAQSSNDVFQALSASKNVEALKTARSFIANVRANEKTESSIFADLGPRFLCLKDQRVKDTTSRHEVDFRAMGRREGKPIALFVALERTKAELLKPLTATFFQQLFDELLAVADGNEEHGGVLPRRVMFYMDEFGNLGAIPAMPTRVTTVRSAGMPLVMAVQTYDQIEALYERKGAAIIIPGVATHIALSSVKGDGAKRFSEGAGETTVVSNSASRSRKRGTLVAKEGGDSQGEQRRALIMPDEVTRLPEDTMLALVGNMPAVLVRQQRYYKVRLLRRRAQRRLANGKRVPTGGPPRPDGPLVAPSLDEEEDEPRVAAHDSERDRQDSMAAMSEEERRLALRDFNPEGFALLEALSLTLDSAVDTPVTGTAVRTAAEVDGAPTPSFGNEVPTTDPFALEDRFGAAPPKRSLPNIGTTARVVRARRSWEEDSCESG